MHDVPIHYLRLDVANEVDDNEGGIATQNPLNERLIHIFIILRIDIAARESSSEDEDEDGNEGMHSDTESDK